MSEKPDISPHTLERHLVPSEEWETCGAPEKLVTEALQQSKASYPTAIAHHPDEGWFGLGTGQGPFIWWWEGCDEDNKER